MRRPRDTRTLDLFAWGIAPRVESTWVPPQLHLLRPEEIEIRPYLDPAYAAWQRGEHFGIVADTASGKTFLAYLIADSVLAAGGIVLLSAPTGPLCEQHMALARRVFRIDPSDILWLPGSWDSKRRARHWCRGRIRIATPQTIANDLARGACSLDGVGLLIIDECHHAAKRHASIAVADAAFHAGVRRIGLTASPGGSAERIERIRVNLHLDRWVRIADVDTSPFRPPVSFSRIDASLPDHVARAAEHLGDVLERQTLELTNRGELDRSDRFPSPAALSDALTSIRGRGRLALLPLAGGALQVSSVLATMVSDDYAVALERLDRALEKRTKRGDLTKTARRLRATSEIDIAHSTLGDLAARGVAHPKQEALISALAPLIDERPVSNLPRVLVFSRSADGVDRIARRLHERFPMVRTEALFGRSRMKVQDAIDLLQAFHRSDVHILVATEAIREGIHVPAIDILIEYSPPRNERELIQLRGRVGRTSPGRIISILANHEADRRYAFAATAKVRRMHALLPGERVRAPRERAMVRTSAFGNHREKDSEQFVRILKSGFVFERFQVEEAHVVTTARGPYVRFRVSDRSGSVLLYHWCPEGRDQAERLTASHQPGSIVIVAGTYDVQGTPRIIVNPREGQHMTSCPKGDYDPQDFCALGPF